MGNSMKDKTPLEKLDQLLESIKTAVDIGVLVKSANGDFYVPEQYKMPISLGFNDVAILQAKNKCTSRLDVNISSEIIRGITKEVPLISSNMSTVTDASFALQMDKLGALGVVHRAFLHTETYLKQVSMLSLRGCSTVAASVGVGKDDYELAKNLIRRGADVLVIDIAHGYSETVKKMAKDIKLFSPETKVVVGNTNNVDMLEEFNDCCDAIKVGIANGLACETKNSAGCNEGQYTSILKFKHRAKELGMPIIGDGGIREPADFVKAMAAGSSSVMAGSIFARCPSSAAEISSEGKKVYAGMASRYCQDKWKKGLKEGTCPEGKIVLLDIGESVSKLIERYSGALRSGITYSGTSNIEEFHREVKMVRV